LRKHSFTVCIHYGLFFEHICPNDIQNFLLVLLCLVLVTVSKWPILLRVTHIISTLNLKRKRRLKFDNWPLRKLMLNIWALSCLLSWFLIPKRQLWPPISSIAILCPFNRILPLLISLWSYKPGYLGGFNMVIFSDIAFIHGPYHFSCLCFIILSFIYIHFI